MILHECIYKHRFSLLPAKTAFEQPSLTAERLPYIVRGKFEPGDVFASEVAKKHRQARISLYDAGPWYPFSEGATEEALLLRNPDELPYRGFQPRRLADLAQHVEARPRGLPAHRSMRRRKKYGEDAEVRSRHQGGGG